MSTAVGLGENEGSTVFCLILGEDTGELYCCHGNNCVAVYDFGVSSVGSTSFIDDASFSSTKTDEEGCSIISFASTMLDLEVCCIPWVYRLSAVITRSGDSYIDSESNFFLSGFTSVYIFFKAKSLFTSGVFSCFEDVAVAEGFTY